MYKIDAKAGEMMKVMIKGVELDKVYQMGEVQIKALDHVSFEIYEGEFMVILGPSGSGKSTLLNLIGGMDSPSSGELWYFDKRIEMHNKAALHAYRKEAVGFVFQNYNLMPNLTAFENVELAKEISSSSSDSMNMLKTVGLDDRADHFPSQLSGGQQQRVAIARALAKDPKLLLCDEPTGALDSKSGRDVLQILSDFCRNYSKTVIIITHNAEIAKIADRVMLIKDGNISKIEENRHKAKIDEIRW